MTDQVRSGYCYRWVVTLTDSGGNRSTVTSGAVLVDASAPRMPIVKVSGGEARSPDLGDLGIGSTYVDGRGVIWVRGGDTGSVPLQVTGSDPESGIARNNANASGAGWHADWVGSSANGNLRLSYGSQSTTATLTVSSVNGAGITGPSTTLTLARDATAPTAATWFSAPTGTVKDIRGSYFRLDLVGRHGQGLWNRGAADHWTLSRAAEQQRDVSHERLPAGWRLPPRERQLVGQRPSVEQLLRLVDPNAGPGRQHVELDRVRIRDHEAVASTSARKSPNTRSNSSGRSSDTMCATSG